MQKSEVLKKSSSLGKHVLKEVLKDMSVFSYSLFPAQLNYDRHTLKSELCCILCKLIKEKHVSLQAN